MSPVINLGDQLREYLPSQLRELIASAGEITQQQGWNLYIVGGLVRDLLLHRPGFDLDLVVEGDAIEVARQLAQSNGWEIVAHHRFGTAKLRREGFHSDIAMSRCETYTHAGALPHVTAGTIQDDLFRRDFTVNAMALYLTPRRYGELFDPYHGKDDLDHHILRVLHQRSFSDDATRIWRALRYEQRLGFQLEPTTAALLRRDVPMLDTISADRLRHEMELVLRECYPEKILHRAGELGVLQQLHPSLEGDGWLEEKFNQLRCFRPQTPSPALYLALIVYPMRGDEIEQFISRLKLPRTWVHTLRDTLHLKTELNTLAVPSLLPSEIDKLLRKYPQQAVLANTVACDNPVVSSRLWLYMTKLRHSKPMLNGEDLKGLGVTPGPRIGQILEALQKARLDGDVKTRDEEAKLVQKWQNDIWRS